MRRIIVNAVCFVVIGMGGLSLTVQAQQAKISGTCNTGWELQCDNGQCCTVCQGSGEIGDCDPADDSPGEDLESN